MAVWTHFTWQHLRRHWKLFTVVLAAMLIGTTLLASLPMFAAVIASDNLNLTLQSVAVPGRNLELSSGGSAAENEFIKGALTDALGERLTEIIELRRTFFEIIPVNFHADGSEVPFGELVRMRLFSFSTLAEETELVEGRYPTATTEVDVNGFTVIEAVVGQTLAQQENLTIGDQFEGVGNERMVRIVGIIGPRDPGAEIWWGDASLLPFGSERLLGQVDTLIMSFIAHPDTVAAFLDHDLIYRVRVNTTDFDTADAIPFRDSLLNLSAQLASRGILINSRLIDVLNRYEVELNDARVSLLLLTAQSVLAVLYAVGMVSSFLLEQARHELSTMAGRGFSAGQVTRLYAVEALLLSFGIAFPLGPPLAFLLIQLWSRVADLPFGSGIPTQSWLLSLAAALFGLLAVAIPIYVASRRQLTDWAGQRVRPPQRPTARRLVFDLILLGLGGLAYWQLRNAGALTQTEATNELLGAADPILLLGPTLLVLALGLIILRLFPFLLQALAYLGQTVRTLILPLGLSRLARDPAGPSRILLLICLTAGLTLFATVFRDSIQVRQVEMARYRSGADIRVIVPLEKEPAQADIATLLALDEGLVGAMVYRNQIAIGSPEGRRVNMIAVDPENFAAVSAFPQGVSQFSLAQIMNVLGPADFESEEAELIPAVFSLSALPAGYAPQDLIPLSLGEQTWGFHVRGTINAFPTVEEPFIVVNIHELERRINVTAADVLLKGLTGRRELWLAVPDTIDQPQLVQAIRQNPPPILGATAQASRIVGDAQHLLTLYRANLIARESIAAFNINAIILAILSSVGFLLIQVFAARRRLIEFGVLRALGLSNQGLLRLLTVEAVILLVLGILMGIGIGFGLAAIMRPFMSTILADSLGGDIVDRLILNPLSLLSVLLALLTFYAAAMLLLLYSLSRSDLQRVLRLGDE